MVNPFEKIDTRFFIASLIIVFAVETLLGWFVSRSGYAPLMLIGVARLLDAYRAASLVIGRDVWIFADSGPAEAPPEIRPSPIIRGNVRGVAADLSLIVEGVETPVASGRLAFAEDCRGGQP